MRGMDVMMLGDLKLLGLEAEMKDVRRPVEQWKKSMTFLKAFILNRLAETIHICHAPRKFEFNSSNGF